MSTYVPRLGKNARAQHLPLNQALREYAGTNNRETLLRLLEPVYEAGNRCSWVKELLESGNIYHPLAWTPDEAYLLLKDLPFTPLKSTKWESVKRSCSCRIASLIDLLRGKLDHGVMEVVTDRKEGLFPLPGEMKFDCDCPDWAGMCKHVAAVLYGVGARLDNSPEMLFVLRGVNHEELVDVTAAITDVAKSGSSRRRIASSGISDVFGIEIADAVPSVEPSVRPAKNIRADKTVVKGTSAKKTLAFPEPLTGDAIRAWRLALGETQAAFAARFMVSGATVSVWEKKGKAEVGMTAVTLALLRKAWQKNNKSDKMPMH
jgi:DNA-binding transcriptional regulator YiaG